MNPLLPFHTQVANAWRLFLHRWGTAILIQLLMIIPSLLMLPLIVEYMAALEEGVDPTVIFQNSAYGSTFVWGFALLLLVGVLTTTALSMLFAAQEKISFITAIAAAVRRYIPVLYTTILSSIAVVGALVPAYLLNYWYYAAARAGLGIDGSGIVAVDAIMLIALIALLIPAAMVGVFLMYAPLLVAVKASPAGFTALLASKHLVRGHMWQLLWRVIGAVILFQILGVSVQSLPLASFLVPFILSVVAIAFFVEVYKEIKGGASYGA